MGKLLRKEVKSRSLHRSKGMQSPCETHWFSPPFVLPHFTLSSVLPSVQGMLFHPFLVKSPLSSYLHLLWKYSWARTFARREFMLTFILRKKLPDSEPLGVCVFTGIFAAPSTLLVLFIHPD